MTNDPRFHGGQEYAPQQMQAPDVLAPQPVMRPAPQAFQPQTAPHSYAAAPPVAPAPHYPAPAPAPAPVAAPVPAKPADDTDGSILVPLSGTYVAHDVTVTHVRFRKPTVRQLRKLGYPLRNIMVDGLPKGVDQVPEVCALYMTALSEPPLPMSTVDQFSLDDFTLCANVITGFFL